jgi:cbb3-type cytochrome oxidase subunit 1
MPPLTRWHLRTALLCLVLGLTATLLNALPAVASAWFALALAPIGIHLLVMGWATQMIFGVAHWMFPRAGKDRTFGSAWLGWTAFWGLNVGLLLRVVGEPLAASGRPVALLLAGSALLQLGAVLAFALTTWRRVRAA